MSAPEDRPRIYIAGPYSVDPTEGTREAVLMGDAVWEAGGCPVIPHLSMLAHLISPRPYEEWLDRDFGLLAACSAVIRLPGESSGADAEVAWAKGHGLPVIHPDTGGRTVAARTAVLIGRRPA